MTPAQARILARLRDGDRIFILGSPGDRPPRPEWESNLPEAPTLRRDVLFRMRDAGLVTFTRSTVPTHLSIHIVTATPEATP